MMMKIVKAAYADCDGHCDGSYYVMMTMMMMIMIGRVTRCLSCTSLSCSISSQQTDKQTCIACDELNNLLNSLLLLFVVAPLCEIAMCCATCCLWLVPMSFFECDLFCVTMMCELPQKNFHSANEVKTNGDCAALPFSSDGEGHWIVWCVPVVYGSFLSPVVVASARSVTEFQF